MPSIINSMFSNTADSSADQTLAYASASGAAAAAQAYFSATLTATTPEVRRLFAEYSSQAVMGHEALLGLMIQKGWANPYDEPTQQLQSVISQAQQSSASQ